MISIPILIIEDDKFFVQILNRSLEQSPDYDFIIEHSSSIKEVKEISGIFLPDIILLDLNILDSQGIDTFLSVKKIFNNALIIILSGTDNRKLAIEMVQLGAQDYIDKSDFNANVLRKVVSFSIERFELMNKISSSEKQYRDLFNNSPEPMVILKGKELTIELMNEAALLLYGKKIESVQGSSFGIFNANNEENCSLKNISNSFKLDITQMDANGELCYIELHGKKIAGLEESYNCIILNKTSMILFELKRMELVFDVQENEKKRIANELHDGLAQKLLLLKLWFANFNFKNEHDPLISSYEQLLIETINDIKIISYALNPPELINGLVNGVQDFIVRIGSQGHFKYSFFMDENFDECDFNDAESLNIFRIIQEFTNNSIKHSKGDLISIEFKKDSRSIQIHLKDNGVGFQMSKIKAGLGLGNMQNRLLFGQFKSEFIETNGKGTYLKIQKNS